MKVKLLTVVFASLSLLLWAASDGSDTEGRTVQKAWFDGGVSNDWPTAATKFGGDWTGNPTNTFDGTAVTLAPDDSVEFCATEAKSVTNHNVEIITRYSPEQFSCEADLPEIPDGVRCGLAVVTGAFYVVVCDEDVVSNIWKRLDFTTNFTGTVDLSQPIDLSVLITDFKTEATTVENQDRMAFVVYKVNGQPLVDRWEYEDEHGETVEAEDEYQVVIVPSADQDEAGHKTVSRVEYRGSCRILDLKGYADIIGEDGTVICRLWHTGEETDYSDLALAVTNSVRGDVITLVGDASGLTVELKPGVTIQFEDGARPPVWTPPSLYRLAQEADVVTGVELDPEQVRPTIAPAEDEKGIEVDATTVTISALNVKKGLYYGLKSAVTLEGLESAEPDSWQQAQDDSGAIVFRLGRGDAAVKFFRVVVTDYVE